MIWLIPLSLLVSGCALLSPDCAHEVGQAAGSVLGTVLGPSGGAIAGDVLSFAAVAFLGKKTADGARAVQRSQRRRKMLTAAGDLGRVSAPTPTGGLNVPATSTTPDLPQRDPA